VKTFLTKILSEPKGVQTLYKETNCGLFSVNTLLHYLYLTWKRS